MNDDNGNRFEAPWGTLLKVVTGAVTVLMAGSLVVIWVSPVTLWVQFLVAVLLVGALIAGPLFQVRGYRIAGGMLEVLRSGWWTRLPLAGLRSVEPVPGRALAGVRLFGNGGFWSFTGWYWNSRLGRYRCFVNDPGRAVLLRYEGRSVVVAPEDPERFMRVLRREAGLG